MMERKLRVYDLNEPNVDWGSLSISHTVAAHLVDMTDKAIVDAILQGAREAGINTLYLLDRDFVVSAIREKLEREGHHETD